ncbi:MAG: hypothetical protein KGQ59_06135 [Bdellovibrionales bacterium]|nr:hypothetical protein [Bdellovibrionales bacterium]
MDRIVAKPSSQTSAQLWQSPLLGGMAGALAAVLISLLSAFALRRLGQEMNWPGVVVGGALGGLAGHGVLRLVMLWLNRRESKKSSMDRFAWLVVTGFVASFVLGGVGMLVTLLYGPGQTADGFRTLGSRLFVLIGWMVGILAASFPLAIFELLREESE